MKNLIETLRNATEGEIIITVNTDIIFLIENDKVEIISNDLY